MIAAILFTIGAVIWMLMIGCSEDGKPAHSKAMAKVINETTSRK